MKTFQKGDCFRIPWDRHLGETFFIVTEIELEENGRQILTARDTLNEDFIISIHNTEVMPA